MEMKQEMIKARRTGKRRASLMFMKETLNSGGNIGVPGCDNPDQIIGELKQMGVDAIATPMIRTTPLQAVWDHKKIEPEIIGFGGGEPEQTGFMFSKKAEQ